MRILLDESVPVQVAGGAESEGRSIIMNVTVTRPSPSSAEHTLNPRGRPKKEDV
jgi:hypothetical protein